jgi:hypothetical protein
MVLNGMREAVESFCWLSTSQAASGRSYHQLYRRWYPFLYSWNLGSYEHKLFYCRVMRTTHCPLLSSASRQCWDGFQVAASYYYMLSTKSTPCNHSENPAMKTTKIFFQMTQFTFTEITHVLPEGAAYLLPSQQPLFHTRIVRAQCRRRLEIF